ncbi:hypothetical protein AB0H58_29475 [Nocardia neocaledoniensis]|uniref:hypothetical protein n=1 Tax=Nocardia neocaledoniensis TaxID=236511 RepID=UPI0033F388E6
MENPGCRASRRLVLPWGELELFARRASVPALLQPTATALELLGDQYLPALVTFRRQPPAPYTAVWPAHNSPPEINAPTDLTLDDFNGVVLAEIHTLTCRACGIHLRAVYPDGGLPWFSDLSAHRMVSECPRCETGFALSRVQALAIVP